MGRGPLQAGDVFLDYRITELIDAGGMGEVYRAVEDYSEDVVAIKCMSPRHVRREDFARRFRQECKFYPKLKHPNIVRMRKAGVSPEHVAYIVMDYLEGRTLRKLLTKAYRLDFLSAMHVMLQVADAMTFVHSKGIWHRDLKPENIMVGTKADAKGHVWLLDFGIAKFADGGMNTDDLPDVGTVRYISPEQVKQLYGASKKAERAKPDGRTDIYAFGAIFYEVLTGKHLFLDDSEPATAEETLTGHLVAAPEPVHEIVPDCPEFVWPVVSRCIAIDVEERYAKFDEVARDLRSLLRDTVPAGHVLARRLAQERIKAEREAAFAGVELEDSAPVSGSGGEAAEGEGETEEARARGESEGGGMARSSEEEEGAKRGRRVAHGETAPLAHFMAPVSALPFAPASRAPARSLRGLGVGYTEPLPSTLPSLRAREAAGPARTGREATAVLGGAWAEGTAQRGGLPPPEVRAQAYAGPPPLPPEVRAQAYAGPPPPPEVRAQSYAGPPPPPEVRAQAYAGPPPPVMETQHAAPPQSLWREAPPLREVAVQYVTPPLPVTQREAPLPEVASPYVTPELREVAAQYVTPPFPSSVTEAPRAASAPLPVAGPPTAPSSLTAPSARPPKPLRSETPRLPTVMIAPPRRAMRAYVLAPLVALGITVVGVGAALGLRAMSGAASAPAIGEPAASAAPAESVTASATSAKVAPAPPPTAVSAAPAPEAPAPEAPAPEAPAPETTASAAAVSPAEAAAEAGAPAKAEAAAEAEASPKEQLAAPARPLPVRTAPAETEDEEDIYPMPKRQKPSFLRVLSEEKKKAAPAPKAAPANQGGAKPAGPCPAVGCRPF
ncbi:protein kinase domain-containing protein [Sorangium sp. So ce887]|uniref:serine/threonine-protein kinase n=1 Tax=Sorangium sp. So ce887 TaxID=3133324 RepID=UPI003F60E7EA